MSHDVNYYRLEAGSLHLRANMAHTETIPRCNRPVDVGPSCDIDRSVVVGVSGIPTRLAEKDGLRLPVGLIAVPTAATDARGIPRVYPNGRHARPLRLVRRKLLELIEGPTVQVVLLPTSNLYPFTNVLQALKSKSQTVALRGFYKTFANAVIYIGGKPALPTREFFELALSRASAAFLQTLAETTALAANFDDVLPGVRVAKRVGSEVDYPGVNAEVALYIFGCGVWDRAGRQKVKLASDVNEVRLALLKLQEFKLTCSRAEKHLLTTRWRENCLNVFVS